MSALKKEEIFNEFDNLIKSLSDEDQQIYADRVKRIKQKVESFLIEEENSLYNGIVYESLKEDWDNEKDDAYNEFILVPFPFEIAVIDYFDDSMEAFRRHSELQKQYPNREIYFFHTSREKLDIQEKKFRLEKLMSQITSENQQEEVDW